MVEPTPTLGIPAALGAAISTRALYPSSHPRTQRALDQLFAAAMARLETRAETTLLVVEGELVADGERLATSSLGSHGLNRAFGRFGIERLTVRAGLEREEVELLLAGLAGEVPLYGSAHVVLGRLFVTEEEASDGGAGEDAAAQAGGDAARTGVLDEGVIDSLGRSFERLRTDLAGGFADLDRQLWQLVAAGAGESPNLVLLGELRGFDDRLFRHSVGVSLWTMAFASALGMSPNLQHELALAGLLHDIGLLEMPPEIVFGRDRSVGDRTRLRAHPEIGAMRLCGRSDMPAIPIAVTLEHHLRADGGPGGYPELGRRPTLPARMVAIADTWEMVYSGTAGRPRPARLEWVAGVLRQRAGKGILDPELVELFLGLTTT